MPMALLMSARTGLQSFSAVALFSEPMIAKISSVFGGSPPLPAGLEQAASAIRAARIRARRFIVSPSGALEAGPAGLDHEARQVVHARGAVQRIVHGPE